MGLTMTVVVLSFFSLSFSAYRIQAVSRAVVGDVDMEVVSMKSEWMGKKSQEGGWDGIGERLSE